MDIVQPTAKAIDEAWKAVCLARDKFEQAGDEEEVVARATELRRAIENLITAATAALKAVDGASALEARRIAVNIAKQSGASALTLLGPVAVQ